MSDLQISAAVLNELRATLSKISGDLDGACRRLRSTDATGVGADPLINRMHDFADEWHYGIGQIGQHADDCVKMLDDISKSADDLDGKLKSQLTQPAQA
ncbi:hypothetical protein ABH935_009786 [Catenulispora sp. GAS73]|uniref:hypothetical protein n=1 Tax=Catenulispora sp. GAS73 TaxID=3156269 RepID=UPI00351732D8